MSLKVEKSPCVISFRVYLKFTWRSDLYYIEVCLLCSVTLRIICKREIMGTVGKLRNMFEYRDVNSDAFQQEQTRKYF